MAKKMKRIGPFGWFARAFAAGFGTVAGVMVAGAIGSVFVGGMLTTNWDLSGVEYPQLVSAPVYATPEVSYPSDRTASAATYYPATSCPVPSCPAPINSPPMSSAPANAAPANSLPSYAANHYPTASYPVVTTPSISAPTDDERPPEPNVGIEAEYYR